MALTKAALRLLARSCARDPFAGPILTLGRQGVYATLDDVQGIIRAAGAKAHALPTGFNAAPMCPGFERLPYSTYTNDQAVFMAMCGQGASSLDVSAYEGADIIHDLNLPIDASLEGAFGLIVDGGTLEHVFHVPQALENICRMLKPGGRVLHMNPVSNWTEHGFYQFSPTFYHDYYGGNGFEIVDCVLVETPVRNLDNAYSSKSRLWQWDCKRPAAPLISSELLTICFEARKTSCAPVRIPQQGAWSHAVSPSRFGAAPAPRQSKLGKVREALVRVSPWAMSLVGPVKRILGRDLSRKPWGLRSVGRI